MGSYSLGKVRSEEYRPVLVDGHIAREEEVGGSGLVDIRSIDAQVAEDCTGAVSYTGTVATVRTGVVAGRKTAESSWRGSRHRGLPGHWCCAAGYRDKQQDCTTAGIGSEIG